MGSDILAVKTLNQAVSKPEYPQKIGKRDWSGFSALDHYGFYAESPSLVDKFCDRLKSLDIEILKGPYDRSDGRSLYFRDPMGLVGEYFYYEEN